MAATEGYTTTVRKLLAAGADVTHRAEVHVIRNYSLIRTYTPVQHSCIAFIFH